ncbi:MAG: flavoprotein [Isosphaeraceae bacterium]|jgi:predicted Rossmann fold flavoprotein|nr:MAG: flavoprotein [Isosphaeraceae bacterium]
MASDLWDVAVLGAGAAGLLAAIRAAELGARVLILEKNRRPGVKILMSGGTRCNLTNARGLRNLRAVSGPIDPAYDPRLSRGTAAIVEAFGPNGAFLRPALKAFSVDATVAFFEANGLSTKIEAQGKIFPTSDRALDVLNVLLRRLDRSGATVRTFAPVIALEPIHDHGPPAFRIHTRGDSFLARTAILAVGGQSYPGCGTSGDGYELARRLGHSLVEPRPALVPLRVDQDWVASLSGVSVPDVQAQILDPAGHRLDHRREAILLTHTGLSGPAILDVSRIPARRDEPLQLELDWLPDLPRPRLDHDLATAARSGRARVANLIPPAIPRRLADALLLHAAIPPDRVGPELSRDERQRLVTALKALRLNITGTLGFAKAEVTSGGIPLPEINPATLESRIQPGLFLCGEILDLDGRIGGYNFQAAWSTGWLAGQHAATVSRLAQSAPSL